MNYLILSIQLHVKYSLFLLGTGVTTQGGIQGRDQKTLGTGPECREAIQRKKFYLLRNSCNMKIH
jgi:hypothetical protein